MSVPGRPTGLVSPTGSGFQSFDTTRPHSARRYDYWLGGKDNFAADRASGDRIAAAFPTIRTSAVENRRFMRRVVAFLAAEAGIRQFLDIGTGIPTSPNVHEVAQGVDPRARVVYVDNDPMVVVHAQALMSSTPQGATAYVRADLREPETILASRALADTLDLTQPVALLLVAVLHFIPDEADPYGLVGRLVGALPAGSFLAVSHATFDPLPPETRQRMVALTGPDAGNGVFQPRSGDEVGLFFDGLRLVDPGLVPIVQWRPDHEPRPQASVADTAVYGAVARRA